MRLKADQEVSSFCCAGLSRIDASILGRMKTSWEMALGLSSTLYLCVAASVPFHTFKLWGKFTASHFLQIDGQKMDRKIASVTRSGILGLILVNSLLCQLDLVFR